MSGPCTYPLIPGPLVLLIAVASAGCGHAPHVVPGPDSETRADRLLRACAAQCLCIIVPYAAFDDCILRCADEVDALASAGIALDEQIDCLAEATDRAEVNACIECVPDDLSRTCDGSGIRACVLGRWVTRPCREGTTCQDGAGGPPSCAEGPCAGYWSRCEGPVLVTCAGHELEHVDCSAPDRHDATCVETGTTAACVTAPVRECDVSHYRGTCDGSVRTACERGFVVERDCGRLPTRTICMMDGGERDGSAICAYPDDAQPCTSDDSRCEGNVAFQCLRGLLLRFDCSPFYTDCDPVAPACFFD